MIRSFLAVAALAALVGCAAPSGPSSAPAIAAPAQDAQSFNIEGRISVRYGDQSLSGKYAWNHAPEKDQVSLASPLGNQLAQIVRDGAGVVLTDNQQQQFRARDVESLTQARLGWRMPLAGLTSWVRGRPQGQGAQAEHDAAGRLSRLKEDGWVIEYGYDGENRQPRRLFLNYTLAEQPLDIRLTIDSLS